MESGGGSGGLPRGRGARGRPRRAGWRGGAAGLPPSREALFEPLDELGIEPRRLPPAAVEGAAPGPLRTEREAQMALPGVPGGLVLAFEDLEPGPAEAHVLDLVPVHLVDDRRRLWVFGAPRRVSILDGVVEVGVLEGQ